MDLFTGWPVRPRQFTPDAMLPFIEAPHGEKAVELKGLDIKVRITGIFAETTQTLRIYNPNHRDLEGTVCFPLPDDAVVCGYALDVEGVLVDGVVVGKQKARQILEAEERKGIDPGLVEQVQGNIYRTRVYPIRAHASRTVQITYISNLTMLGNDAAYHLPLLHAAKLQDVNVHVEVVQSPVVPMLTGGIGNMSLRQAHHSWVAQAQLKPGTPTEDLLIRLPSLPAVFTMLEKTAAGETFFCASSVLSAATGTTATWIPERIGIAWDASYSRHNRIEKELALLEALAKHWSKTKIDLLVFRDVAESTLQTFDLKQDGVEKLISLLRDLPYDGATNFSALDLTTHTHASTEAWFLFSDGLSTMNRGLPKMGNTQLYTVSSQAQCNAGLLAYLAESGKGQHINLLRTGIDVVTQHILQRQQPVMIATQNGVESIYLNQQPGRISVTGRITGSTASLKLNGGGVQDHVISLNMSEAVTGELLARNWAGLESQRVAIIKGDGSESLVELGRKYGLVTPGTSLLVLENLSQYLEYEVEPPATLANMRAEYQRVMRERVVNKKTKISEHIETVLRLWQRRIQWWETRFEFTKKEQQKSHKRFVGETPFDAPLASHTAREQEISFTEDVAAPSPMRDEISSVMRPRRSAVVSDAFAESGGGDGHEPTQRSTQASVKIKPWSPDSQYMREICDSNETVSYQRYLQQREQYQNSPSFMLDVSDYFLTQKRNVFGVRILSNLLEQGLDDVALMRIYGWRLQQAEFLDQAVEIFERVLRQRDDEPQSHRDLALVLAQRWEVSGDDKDAVRAMELLYHVISTGWERFPEIELIALMELNCLINKANQKKLAIPAFIDSRLIRNLDLDVRISLSWDADLTDVDLHVFEPSGEHAFYGHNRTDIGGLVSLDYRQGYGPEEYVIRRAMPGKYIIKAHYYGSHQQTLCGACTVTATVFTNYGRSNETRQTLTLRLDKPHNEVVVGEIVIGDEAQQTGSTGNNTDAFRQLRKGMTVDDVVHRVGQPTTITGAAELLLRYDLGNDTEIRIHMNPNLVSVQHVTHDAVIDLVV